MTDFKLDDRVEFDAKDRVNVGTVVEHHSYPILNLEVVVIVNTDDGETWVMHPDSLRLVQEETND